MTTNIDRTPLAQLPPFPNGWYALATAVELKKGKVLIKKLAGKEIVLYRTQSGQACAIDPYCPHMGAHFGHGGTIEGEDIRCPFHGFCFNPEGNCTKTAYGSLPSKRAKLQKYPIQEVAGFIMVYYHVLGEAPDWFIPQLDTTDWTTVDSSESELKSHPQETTENSVDIGHFTVTHGFQDVDIIEPARTEGPYLTATYILTHPPLIPKLLSPMRIDFQVHVHGLGYSLVEVNLKQLGLTLRNFVLPIPTEEGKIKLRLAVSIKKPEQKGLLKLLPIRLSYWLLSKIIMRQFIEDVAPDVEIWENKKYIARPLLALGDGPIAEYRQWAKQFYTLAPQQEELVASVNGRHG